MHEVLEEGRLVEAREGEPAHTTLHNASPREVGKVALGRSPDRAASDNLQSDDVDGKQDGLHGSGRGRNGSCVGTPQDQGLLRLLREVRGVAP